MPMNTAQISSAALPHGTACGMLWLIWCVWGVEEWCRVMPRIMGTISCLHWPVAGIGLSLQASLQRLQEELQSHVLMLNAREEGEALLKAEVQRLTEENTRLHEEGLERRGELMGLQEQLAELATAGDDAAAAQVTSLSLYLIYLSSFSVA